MIVTVVVAGIVVVAGPHPADPKSRGGSNIAPAVPAVIGSRTNPTATPTGPDEDLGCISRACQRDHQTAQQRSGQKDLAHISICPRALRQRTTLSDAPAVSLPRGDSNMAKCVRRRLSGSEQNCEIQGLIFYKQRVQGPQE